MGESATVIQISIELLGTSNSISATKVVGLEVYATAPDLKYTLLPDIVAYCL